MPMSLGYKAQTKHCTNGQSMTERPSTLCWNVIREYSQKIVVFQIMLTVLPSYRVAVIKPRKTLCVSSEANLGSKYGKVRS